MHMKMYSLNSPEAMARVVTLMIVTDGHIDRREIEKLDQLNAYGQLGLERKAFMAVARDYCSELVAEAEANGSCALLDPQRTDRVISCVNAPDQQRVVVKLLRSVMNADQQQRSSELVVMNHILERWKLQ
jgi:uncharacterized tellurite resistance protein B-like protein